MKKRINKKVLITGGLGFLGAYCIDRYRKEGWNVSIIDNMSTNTVMPEYLNKDEKFYKQDILDYKWSKKEVFELIVHLASPVGPAGILKHSGKIAKYIIDDIYWAIAGAQIHDCPLIFVSTSEIYGYRDTPVLLTEDADKILIGDFKVRNEYSMTKLVSEIVLSNVAKVSKLQYQIVRPFNISGARQLQQGGFVLPTFVKQALANKDITVFGDGQQVRAFTHVRDIVDGIFRTSTCNVEWMNNIWNIGNAQNKLSILDMAKKVKKYTGSKSNITFVDPKTIHGPLYEEAWDKIPNANKANLYLKWFPEFSVDEIINDVINYYKKN